MPPTDPLQQLNASLTGRYTVEREIGRGGMATVFLASDLRHDRPVAIKVLHPELVSSVGAQRFLREIRIAGRLLHPHILPLLDSGEAEGLLYYVTPYVAGGTLRERLARDGRLGVTEALRIAREVGSGLDFAHQQGFVHRDVKPGNILLADTHAMLADFGIARACGAVTGDGITSAGLSVGTPEYMSPEQAAGDSDLGAASDTYSLACVVYEMLTGRPPFVGKNSRATITMQVTAHADPLRLHRPDASGHLERTLTRALGKVPEERYASVRDFVEALGSTGAEQRTSRGSVGAIAQRVIAVLPFVNTGRDADDEYLSDGLTDELIDALMTIDGLGVASRTSVFALKGKPLDVRAVGAVLGATWVLEGTVRRTDDKLRITARLCSADDGRLLWSERYDRQVNDVLQILESLAGTIVDTLRATSFASLAQLAPRRYTKNVTAYGFYLRGRFALNKRTDDGLTEAIGFFEQAIGADPKYAPAYAGLADSYALQLDYRSVPVDEGHALAKRYARQAIALDDGVAEAHTSLGWTTFIHDWDWATAEREFTRAIELDPSYATAHQWYAFLLAAHARTDEALVESHIALELDPASVSIRRSAGYAYFYARRYDQVKHHLRRALAMNPFAEETCRVLGLSQSLQGKHADALEVLRAATTLPDASSYTTATLGFALARAGEQAEARTVLDWLRAESERAYVSPVAFATIYIGLGELDDAIAWAARCVDERRGWPVYFRVNPVVDPLRGDPRFTALIARMGFAG